MLVTTRNRIRTSCRITLSGQLRSLLCPAEAASFADWKWAQAADIQNGGSWFAVPFELIDNTDPDCVWRLRKTSAKERKKIWPW